LLRIAEADESSYAIRHFLGQEFWQARPSRRSTSITREPQQEPKQKEAQTQLQARSPASGSVPTLTPDLPKLPSKSESGVKVFHLTADVVKREFLPASEMGPAKVVDVWGYNGSESEANVRQGDSLR
jgi:hypothetical protein